MLDDAENFRSTEKSIDCVDEKCVWRPELRASLYLILLFSQIFFTVITPSLFFSLNRDSFSSSVS